MTASAPRPTPTNFVASLKTSVAEGTPFPTPQPRTPDAHYRIVDLSFIDRRRGWALGVSDVATEVLATVDAGQTWTKVYSGPLVGLRIQFTDESHGWVVGHEACAYPPDSSCHGVLLRAGDGGSTWSKTSPTADWPVDVSFIDASDGWMLVEQNCSTCSSLASSLLRTADGGATWQAATIPAGQYAYSPRAVFRFAKTGIVARRDDIIVSKDDGATWSIEATGAAEGSCTRRGSTTRSTAGRYVATGRRAGRWSRSSSTRPRMAARRGSSGRSFCLAAERRPLVWGSAPSSSAGDMEFSTAMRGWMSTSFGLEGSVDSGRNWTPAEQATIAVPAGRIDFVDADTGFTTSGYVTFDGGDHWESRPIEP